MAPKKQATTDLSIDHIKPADEIGFFVSLKCQISTVILSLGVKYSMHDLISDVSY